jgi:hypothetical protein
VGEDGQDLPPAAPTDAAAAPADPAASAADAE